jgi:hypothetical protein
MKAALVVVLLFLFGCAERQLVGITISNSPDKAGVCIPPKPGGGC